MYVHQERIFEYYLLKNPRSYYLEEGFFQIFKV